MCVFLLDQEEKEFKDQFCVWLAFLFMNKSSVGKMETFSIYSYLKKCGWKDPSNIDHVFKTCLLILLFPDRKAQLFKNTVLLSFITFISN